MSKAWHTLDVDYVGKTRRDARNFAHGSHVSNAIYIHEHWAQPMS